MQIREPFHFCGRADHCRRIGTVKIERSWCCFQREETRLQPVVLVRSPSALQSFPKIPVGSFRTCSYSKPSSRVMGNVYVFSRIKATSLGALWLCFHCSFLL